MYRMSRQVLSPANIAHYRAIEMGSIT